MVKLTKIYTRGGDAGKTSLAGGTRVDKHHPRIAAYGAVDEANATLGLARLHLEGEHDAMLGRIQNDLFDLGADLATPGTDFTPRGHELRMVQSQIDRLESEIDRMNAELAPLTSFVLPGGAPAAAWLHLTRTVVRRAERLATALAAAEAVNPLALGYLNRLSDHVFVLSRLINAAKGGDVLWIPGGER